MRTEKFRLHLNLENRSRFPIDIVWENAKDLEHVATLHRKTNKAFELLYVGRESQLHEYDVMFYQSLRRLVIFPLHSFGFRKIQSVYNLVQIECIPLLGLTVVLNSLLKPLDNLDYPTQLVDEVVIEGPFWMKFFSPLIARSLRRHTQIQCQEDESYRERRNELVQRGIRLPYRLYSSSRMERISALFKEKLNTCLE